MLHYLLGGAEEILEGQKEHTKGYPFHVTEDEVEGRTTDKVGSGLQPSKSTVTNLMEHKTRTIMCLLSDSSFMQKE